MSDDIEVHEVENPGSRREDVLRVLGATDEEFHPPLSGRHAADGSSDSTGLEKYVEENLEDGLLVAEVEGETAGVVVYHEDHDVDHLPEDATYVQTVAVKPGFRGEGVGRALYQALFDFVDPGWVGTKTWGSNSAHLGLLDDLGFTEVARLPDDRPGGVDTLYLALER